MTIAKRVTYSGRVQGVGFRYTAHDLARSFGMAGYVRNKPDGSVELFAEGAAHQVDTFLDAIAGQMAGFIEQTKIEDVPPTEIKGFNITR
jgi:acylphosphatase